MISRDFDTLQKEYDDLRGVRDDMFVGLPEMQFCKVLLVERANALKRLKKAMDSKRMDAVEQALAVVCYYDISGETVVKAKEFIDAVDSNTSLALRPLIRSVRANHADDVHAALRELHRIGWHDPALKPEVVYMILDRYNDNVKVRLSVSLYSEQPL
jgi:hypothetical protein